VWAGGVAVVADFGDGLSGVDGLADGDEVAVVVAVGGDEAAAVVDADRGTEGFGTKSGARACFCWSKGLLSDVQYDGRFGQPGNPTRP
jgi:hypothetical protein